MAQKILKKHDCGIIELSRTLFQDERGLFSELFSLDGPLSQKGISFVQDNLSLSRKGALRGLHLQKEPYSQGKLISCLKGEIFDVVVDLRKSSQTFGSSWSFSLNEKNALSLYIPKGFAHGFCALQEDTLVHYKTTDPYKPSSELTLKWDDPDLNISWPFKKPLVSEKDSKGRLLKNLDL